MISQHFIYTLLVIALSLSSCVSKKKFVEMQDGRVKAEEQVRQLTEENSKRATRIEALIADFEVMKNELMESNAMKDQYIDSLNNDIFVLQESITQQKDSLQETSFNFGFERQRMIEEIRTKDKTIGSLKSRIETLDKELTEKSAVISDKNFQLKVLSDKISTLETEKDRGENEREELNQELQEIREDITALNINLKKKDETITRLQNNVNLLKKELGRN